MLAIELEEERIWEVGYMLVILCFPLLCLISLSAIIRALGNQPPQTLSSGYSHTSTSGWLCKVEHTGKSLEGERKEHIMYSSVLTTTSLHL